VSWNARVWLRVACIVGYARWTLYNRDSQVLLQTVFSPVEGYSLPQALRPVLHL